MWEQLNQIMQERNLNGNQLSKMAGVNRSFFSDLKTGKVKYLSWPNMCKIADALEVSLDEFRQKEGNMNELERTALNEILRTVTYIAEKLDELDSKISLNDSQALEHQES